MRQNFSYILCAMFMLFGTSQILHGAAALADLGEELVVDASKTLEEEGANQAVETVARQTAEEITSDLKGIVDRTVLDVGATVATKALVEEAAVEAVAKEIVNEASTGAMRSGADLLTAASEAAGKGAESAEVTAEAAAQLKLTRGIGGRNLPVAPEVPAPTPIKPHAAVVSASGGVEVPGRLASTGERLVDDQAQIINAKNFAVNASNHAVKCVMGSFKMEDVDVLEVAGKGQTAFGDIPDVLKPDISDSAKYPAGSVTKDTLFDAKGEPIENTKALQDLGAPKYKSVGDPVPKLDAKGNPEVIQSQKIDANGKPMVDAAGKPVMEDKFVTATKSVPVKDPITGDPVKYELSDIFGDAPASKFFAKGLIKVGKGIGDFIHMIGVQGMIMGMAMSVPNSLMASFTQERMQQAALATIGAPVDFGGVVMQIPDELINIEVPDSSLKIYVGVPASSASSQTQWGGGSSPSATNLAVGPDLGNAISGTIASLAKDQFRALMTTIMSATNQMGAAGSSASIPRYTFFEGDSKNPSFYDQAHLFASYSPQSYITWGSSAITDPGFPSLMIDLNTGYIFAEDGTTLGNASAPLLVSIPNGTVSVETFLGDYASNLTASNLTFNYAQYTGGGQASVDSRPGSALARQFSTSCIVNPATASQPGGGNSGFGDACMMGNFRYSLLATSLLRIAAGLCIDQNGQELSLTASSTPLLSITAATNTSTAASQAATMQSQITAFYQNTQQQINFAMQPQYVSAQAACAQAIPALLTQAQQINFVQTLATSVQQQAFVNTVYGGLAVSAQPAFETAFAACTTDSDEIALVFTTATSAQKTAFMNTIVGSLSQAQLVKFIQQYASANQLQALVQQTYGAAGQDSLNTFAQASLASSAQVAAQSALQTQAAAGGGTVDSVNVLQGINASAVLQEAIAQGALGGVVPIFGFADGLQTFLSTNFSSTLAQNAATPGGSQKVITGLTTKSLSNALASGINSATLATSANSNKIQGASNLNYPALGVYIYECKNTPFAKELESLTNKQALDYIVFFDKFLNVVPLQVVAPSADPAKFNLSDYELNPAIAYWTSLICFIGNGNGPLDEFMGRYVDPTTKAVTVFFPLYTLSGNVAYVQGAATAVQAFLTALNTPPAAGSNAQNTMPLYAQIETIAAVEIATYHSGPFYAPYNLIEASAAMWMSGASTTGSNAINIVPYVGMPPYPMTLNVGATSGPTDYLIPCLTENGSSLTVQLPNPNVETFVSLVTDIVFTASVASNGQTIFTPTSFKNSPYNPATGINSSKIPTFAFLNNFTGSGVTAPAALVKDLAAQRAAWVAFINSSLTDPTFNAQVHGFPFGQKYTLTIVNSDDYRNKNYMYTCFPSPSGIATDLYVMSALGSLSSTNTTIGLIANAGSPQSYIVSMATGYMYDSNGNVVKSGSGKPVYLAQSALLALIKKNQGGVGPSAATLTALNNINQQGLQMLQTIQGPYEFGTLVLNLYQADVLYGNYVYFTLDQNKQPSDYFVVVQSAQPPFVFGGAITGATQNMVSLVTGQLYTRSGIAGTWPNLSTLLASVQATMDISAADLTQISNLNAAFIAQAKAQMQEQSGVAAQVAAAKAQILEDIGNIAANVIVKPYLPAPYDSLVQDTSGKYYRITPGSDGKPFMIFDFNATAASNDSGVGAIFMADGTFVTIMNGIHLAGMRQQFGVQVSSTGAQNLTIPHFVGNMHLSVADQSIVPGQSGTALIVSSDPQFPVPGIFTVVPTATDTNTYYFYYHTFLNSFFVYVKTTSGQNYYISMVDGTAYNLDGSARVLNYQVAFDTKGNPMVVTQDTNGMVNVTFADPASGAYVNFVSDPTQFVCSNQTYNNVLGMYGINYSYGTGTSTTALYIYQNMPANPGSMKFNPAATSYLVYIADPTTGAPVFLDAYTINATSNVQGLTYVPVSSTGQIVKTAVSGALQSASLIVQGSSIANVIFNGTLYKPSSGTLTFVPVTGSGESISIQSVPATQSCAAYVTITQGAQEYIYSYAYQTLSATDFTNYMKNTWKMVAAMDPNAKAVLCKYLNTKGLKSIAVGVDAVTSAVPSNVKNVPASLAPGVKNAIKNITFDSVSGKYFVSIVAADYSYFGQAGYVDIENGCFYDTTGKPSGCSLILSDYVALLNKLNVIVVYNISSKRYDIVYRSAAVITKEAAVVAPATTK